MLLAVRLKWRESVVLLGFDLSVKLSRSVRFVITFILPRINKSSCIADFSEKEKKTKNFVSFEKLALKSHF